MYSRGRTQSILVISIYACASYVTLHPATGQISPPIIRDNGVCSFFALFRRAAERSDASAGTGASSSGGDAGSGGDGTTDATSASSTGVSSAADGAVGVDESKTADDGVAAVVSAGESEPIPSTASSVAYESKQRWYSDFIGELFPGCISSKPDSVFLRSRGFLHVA